MFNIRTIFRIARVTLISLSLNLGVVAGAAWVLTGVWNRTLVGFGNLPAMNYVRAFGILATVKIVAMVVKGFQLYVSLEE
jgi:hypothetical protein